MEKKRVKCPMCSGPVVFGSNFGKPAAEDAWQCLSCGFADSLSNEGGRRPVEVDEVEDEQGGGESDDRCGVLVDVRAVENAAESKLTFSSDGRYAQLEARLRAGAVEAIAHVLVKTTAELAMMVDEEPPPPRPTLLEQILPLLPAALMAAEGFIKRVQDARYQDPLFSPPPFSPPPPPPPPPQPIPQSYQDRVLAEQEELWGRIDRLHTFIFSDKFATLEEDERARLLKQDEAMRAYADILDERISHFPVA